MAAGYSRVCAGELPKADVVIDKFHVMRYVYDAVPNVRPKTERNDGGYNRGRY